MKLSPRNFNRFLGGDVRQDFGWRQHSACPCVNTKTGTGSADPRCQVCDRKGHIWATEVMGVAGMTNQTPRKAMDTFGSWEPGDCVMTIPMNSPLYAARRFDRFRAVESTNPFSQFIDPNINPIFHGTVVEITRLFWLDPGHTEIIEGDIPTIAPNGAVIFGENAPPAGTPYTLEGSKYDEFFIFGSLASDRNSGTTGLPLKLVARAFDVLGR